MTGSVDLEDEKANLLEGLDIPSEEPTSWIDSKDFKIPTHADSAPVDLPASGGFDVSRYAEGSPLERYRQASLADPVPNIVMNDRVRAYEPTEEDFYFTIPDGRYVNKIYSGVKLREFEAEKV